MCASYSEMTVGVPAAGIPSIRDPGVAMMITAAQRL